MNPSSDPPLARHARQCLDVAWNLWETMPIPAFYDPAVLAALDERLRAGEAWLAQHRGQADYGKGQMLLRKLMAEREKGNAELARWQQREAEFLAAERDYLDLVHVGWLMEKADGVGEKGAGDDVA